jgi:hypothetical protein
VCASFIEEPICSNPKHGFETGIKAVVGNVAFRQYFQALCRNYSDTLDKAGLDYAARAVYNVVVQKVVQSRSTVLFQLFKVKHIKAKAKIALQNTLKVDEAGGCKHQTTVTATPGVKQKLPNTTSANKNSRKKGKKIGHMKRPLSKPNSSSVESSKIKKENDDEHK